MRIGFRKYLSIGFLSAAVLVMTCPGLVLSKATKPTKPTKATQKTSPLPKTHESKAAPTTGTLQDALQCDAQAAVLIDALTGQVLYEQNPSVKIPPASFVKVMTLYLAYDALRAGQLKLEDMVTVSEKAWRIQGSKMFIKVGDRVKVEDLLKGIAIASGNDACIALAEHMAGSEETFVTKMNEKGRLLGLKETHFNNSHGMPVDDQYTTAMDMATLSRRYIEDHPGALALHSSTEYEYNGIRQGNRNTLLQKNIGVDGLKTGHVEESGYHLVATAKRDGQRMIAVVMGCDKVKKRAPEAQKLLEYGFKNFATVEVVKKGASFGPVKVRRGKEKEVLLTADGEARITVSKGKENSVSVMPQLPAFVVAPIQKGQVVAKALVQQDGKMVKEVNLLASMSVEKSLIPPWPVLVVGILGLVVVGGIALWWLRRRQTKKTY